MVSDSSGCGNARIRKQENLLKLFHCLASALLGLGIALFHIRQRKSLINIRPCFVFPCHLRLHPSKLDLVH